MKLPSLQASSSCAKDDCNDPCKTAAKDAAPCDQRCVGQPDKPFCVGNAVTGELGLSAPLGLVIADFVLTPLARCFLTWLLAS
jgi:hypothetical protein